MTTKPRGDADTPEPEVKVPPQVKARRRMLGDDYGKWVATQDIYYGGAMAYAEGSPVPDTNVKRHDYDKQDPPWVKLAEGQEV